MSEDGPGRLAFLPPDDGGWYSSPVGDWVALAPISDGAVRAWLIARGLVMERRSPVRRLLLDEFCRMVPVRTTTGDWKPSSIGRMRDLFRELSGVGLISTPDGSPVSISSKAKGEREVVLRINDWPRHGYDGWSNGYAKLDAIRAGLPADRPATKQAEPAPPGPRPAPKGTESKAAAGGQGAEAPAAKGGWKSNPPAAGGWISNPSGWKSNQRGWKSNSDHGPDLEQRQLPLIPLPSIPLSSAPAAPGTTREPAATGSEREMIHSAGKSPTSPLNGPQSAQQGGRAGQAPGEAPAAPAACEGPGAVPAPRDAADSSQRAHEAPAGGGASGGQAVSRAEEFVTELPGRLGRASVHRLAPLVAAAFAAGYTAETLRAELDQLVDVSRIKYRSALPGLYERALGDLPPAVPAGRAGGRERCPDHPARYRRGCVECALAVPA